MTEHFQLKRAVLIESLRPIFAFRKGRQGFAPRHSVDDLKLLKRMGIKVGLVFHGSDIRDPYAHALRNPHSPFWSTSGHPISANPAEPSQILRPEALSLAESSATNRQLLATVRRAKIPIFVTTPDLFHEVPDAHWLPVVIDINRFAPISQRSPIFSTEKLRVLYMPSRSWIKSSHLITPILEKLRDEGVIEYKNWSETGAVKHSQMPELVEASDLVIDQFLGIIGVFPLEAAAAGRLVATLVEPSVSQSPIPPHIPITPNTLEDVIRGVAKAREGVTLHGQQLTIKEGKPHLEFKSLSLTDGIQVGIDFVHYYHDGRYSAAVMERELNL